MAGMQEFGQLIKKARKERGLSGKELARRIGRPPSFIVRIELGRNTFPLDPYDFANIARALDMPREPLLVALGYLERAPVAIAAAGEPSLIGADDPRVELLHLVEGESDDRIRDAIRILETVLAVFDDREQEAAHEPKP